MSIPEMLLLVTVMYGILAYPLAIGIINLTKESVKAFSTQQKNQTVKENKID